MLRFAALLGLTGIVLAGCTSQGTFRRTDPDPFLVGCARAPAIEPARFTYDDPDAAYQEPIPGVAEERITDLGPAEVVAWAEVREADASYAEVMDSGFAGDGYGYGDNVRGGCDDAGYAGCDPRPDCGRPSRPGAGRPRAGAPARPAARTGPATSPTPTRSVTRSAPVPRGARTPRSSSAPRGGAGPAPRGGFGGR